MGAIGAVIYTHAPTSLIQPRNSSKNRPKPYSPPTTKEVLCLTSAGQAIVERQLQLVHHFGNLCIRDDKRRRQ